MTFEETTTLVNLDSDVRIDVESLARIEISDVEYLLEKVASEKDSRLLRILYETIVSKTSSIFQLAQRACCYLELGEKCKQIRNAYPKSSPSGIGAIASFRDDLFHNGITFVKKEMFFPFGKVSGRAYVAIRVKEGGTLDIRGLHCFNASGVEYAVTSEGIFEIKETGTPDEAWKLMDVFPNLTVTNYSDIDAIVKSAITELKGIWSDLSAIRKSGDGNHEYAFLNEGATFEIIEASSSGLHSYSLPENGLVITGAISFTPPKGIVIEEGKLAYEA